MASCKNDFLCTLIKSEQRYCFTKSWNFADGFLLIGASQKLKILWKGVLRRDTNTGEPAENTSVHRGPCTEL